MFGCWCWFILRYNSMCSVFHVKPIGLSSDNGQHLPHFDTVKTVIVKQAIFPYVLLMLWLQKYANPSTLVVINSHTSLANQHSKCPTCISSPKTIVTQSSCASQDYRFASNRFVCSCGLSNYRLSFRTDP